MTRGARAAQSTQEQCFEMLVQDRMFYYLLYGQRNQFDYEEVVRNNTLTTGCLLFTSENFKRSSRIIRCCLTASGAVSLPPVLSHCFTLLSHFLRCCLTASLCCLTASLCCLTALLCCLTASGAVSLLHFAVLPFVSMLHHLASLSPRS